MPLTQRRNDNCVKRHCCVNCRNSTSGFMSQEVAQHWDRDLFYKKRLFLSLWLFQLNAISITRVSVIGVFCTYFKNYWNSDCSFRYQSLLRFLVMVNHAARGKHWERNATKEDTTKVWGITTRKLICYRSGSRKKVRILTHPCFWLPLTL